MTSREDDRLLGVLRKWEADHAPSDEQSDDLVRRIKRIVQSLDPSAAVVSYPRRALRWQPSFAIAAAVIAMLGLGVWWTSHRPKTALDEHHVGSLAELDANTLTQKEMLFASCDELFAEHLCWIVEVPQDTELGLSERGSTANSDERAIAIRLVVLTRTNDTQWQQAWTCDVTTRTQELVQIPVRALSATHLDLWAYRLPDGNFAIDTNLVWQGPVRIDLAASEIQSPLGTKELVRVEAGNAEYLVLQTVANVPRSAS